MARVLIVDAHAVARAGYRRFLKAKRSVTEFGEAATAAAMLRQLDGSLWDGLIVDIQMADRRGLEVLKEATSRHPLLRVLVVSELPEHEFARAALQAGAGGYLDKGVSRLEFLRAFSSVMAGQRYVSADVAAKFVVDLEYEEDADRALHERLSVRELQVFCKLASGTPVSIISADLRLTVKTLSTYRLRILEKMRLATNADVTRYAFRNGLIA